MEDNFCLVDHTHVNIKVCFTYFFSENCYIQYRFVTDLLCASSCLSSPVAEVTSKDSFILLIKSLDGVLNTSLGNGHYHHLSTMVFLTMKFIVVFKQFIGIASDIIGFISAYKN